jgi:hypothetical protein
MNCRLILIEFENKKAGKKAKKKIPTFGLRTFMITPLL